MKIKNTALATISIFGLSLLLMTASVAASPAPDKTETKLLSKLATADSEAAGRKIESLLWEYWFSLAPTLAAQELLHEGRRRRETYDYANAEKLLSELIEAEPAYAEGYNQRAFVRFLRDDIVGSLEDLEITLQLKPWHFGALSGLYHVLRVQNRHGVAFDTLRQAVAIHPWIQERFALPREQWPENYRLIHGVEREI